MRGEKHNFIPFRESFAVTLSGNPEKGPKDETVLETAPPWTCPAHPCRIVWKAILPGSQSFNILGENLGFAGKDPPFVVFRPVYIAGTENLTTVTSKHVEGLFDRKTGFGTIRIFAEVSSGDEIYRTPVLTISRYKDDSYLGKLTAIFNLPYIFGSGLIRADGDRGADAMYGADCSSFLIYGLRMLGFRIPYLNPAQMEPYLHELGSILGFKNGLAYGNKGTITFVEDAIPSGLFLHFGSHMAVLYEDRPPKNILNKGDLVLHQLEGFPEIVPIETLKASRKPFRLMTVKSKDSL
jgi:hypothetical protein